jgi:hypothetical protein
MIHSGHPRYIQRRLYIFTSEYANLSPKQRGGQEEDDQAETDADHAERNARPQPHRETSEYLVPPRVDLDLGSEW